MFNIEVEDQNMFVYSDIIGVNGTFAGGTSFVYDGHNPVGNYAILPEYPAFNLFTIQILFTDAGLLTMRVITGQLAQLSNLERFSMGFSLYKGWMMQATGLV
ncbi:MAG: hypothetical protein R2764_21215 [Bacteroidales bacterium]